MPLPAPATDRNLLHTRTIVCEGYARADGLLDIDGWLTDVKTYDVPNQDRGGIPAGEPVHGMGLRMTITAELAIVDMAAVQDYTPFSLCPAITPRFRRLIGLTLTKGFRHAVRERLGGVQGCVHLVDLLDPMVTTAYQTLAEPRYRAFQESVRRGEPANVFFINSCHAWDETGELTKREFPGLHKSA
jgi:hypothetical protein